MFENRTKQSHFIYGAASEVKRGHNNILRSKLLKSLIDLKLTVKQCSMDVKVKEEEGVEGAVVQPCRLPLCSIPACMDASDSGKPCSADFRRKPCEARCVLSIHF